MNDVPEVTDMVSLEMGVLKDDVRNCYALSLDRRIDEIVQLTSDIEEMLGLTTDKEYRESRVEHFRQQALINNINPQLDDRFNMEVDNYLQILQEKKATLQSIFDCCNDFCLTMKNEMNQMSNVFATNPSVRNSFVNDFNKRRESPGLRSDKQRRNRLPSSALSILWDFVRTHKNNPYPTNQQKEHLVRQTKLTMTQIRNWFTNTRKRKLNQTPESDDDYSMGSDGDFYSLPSSPSEDLPLNRRRQRKKKTVYQDQTLYTLPPADLSPPPISPPIGGLTIDTSIQPKTDAFFPTMSPRTPSGTWIQYDQNTPRLFRGLSISSGRCTPQNVLSYRCTPRGDHHSIFDLEFPDPPLPEDGFFGNNSPGNQHELEFFINNEILPQCKKEEDCNSKSCILDPFPIQSENV